jgi:hypothetical protein
VTEYTLIIEPAVAYDLLVDEPDQPEIVIEVEGPQGPAGAPGGMPYEHIQAPESTTWIVNHNLGHRPVVAVLDIGGAEIEADVRHMSLNQCRVYLSVPAVGTVICS